MQPVFVFARRHAMAFFIRFLSTNGAMRSIPVLKAKSAISSINPFPRGNPVKPAKLR
jgi:hypothetical protein